MEASISLRLASGIWDSATRVYLPRQTAQILFGSFPRAISGRDAMHGFGTTSVYGIDVHALGLAVVANMPVQKRRVTTVTAS